MNEPIRNYFFLGFALAFSHKKHGDYEAGDTGIKVFACGAGACNGNISNQIFRVTGNIPINQWHHVAVVFDATSNTIACYYDGQHLGGWNKEMPAGTTKDLLIGGAPDLPADRHFEGKMKKINIEKDILTPAEILALYNAGH